MEKTGNIQGRACAFTDKDIRPEMSTVRRLSGTPRDLGILVTEGVENLQVRNDPQLRNIAQRARKAGMKYVIEATGAYSSERKSEELAEMANVFYASPAYKAGEKFRGEIVYKDYSGDCYNLRN